MLVERLWRSPKYECVNLQRFSWTLAWHEGGDAAGAQAMRAIRFSASLLIVYHCCDTWNRLVEQPWRVIGPRLGDLGLFITMNQERGSLEFLEQLGVTI